MRYSRDGLASLASPIEAFQEYGQILPGLED